jgi:CRP/FNR family transcriptional regulator
MKIQDSSQTFCSLIKKSAIARDRVFEKNDYLFRETEIADGIYYITEGKVKIVKNKNVDFPVILHIAKEGELLGLQAVINSTSHANDAIAIDAVKTYFVPGNKFLEEINKDPDAKMQIMQWLCTRIDKIENQISSRSEKSANQRFAEVLTFLAKDYGLSEDKMLNIELSIEELAGLSGTTKQYLSKIIFDFSHEGLIKNEQGHFKILEMPKLEKIANT